jgi:hypothetical protein
VELSDHRGTFGVYPENAQNAIRSVWTLVCCNYQGPESKCLGPLPFLGSRIPIPAPRSLHKLFLQCNRTINHILKAHHGHHWKVCERSVASESGRQSAPFQRRSHNLDPDVLPTFGCIGEYVSEIAALHRTFQALHYCIAVTAAPVPVGLGTSAGIAPPQGMPPELKLFERNKVVVPAKPATTRTIGFRAPFTLNESEIGSSPHILQTRCLFSAPKTCIKRRGSFEESWYCCKQDLVRSCIPEKC